MDGLFIICSQCLNLLSARWRNRYRLFHSSYSKLIQSCALNESRQWAGNSSKDATKTIERNNMRNQWKFQLELCIEILSFFLFFSFFLFLLCFSATVILFCKWEKKNKYKETMREKESITSTARESWRPCSTQHSMWKMCIYDKNGTLFCWKPDPYKYRWCQNRFNPSVVRSNGWLMANEVKTGTLIFE